MLSENHSWKTLICTLKRLTCLFCAEAFRQRYWKRLLCFPNFRWFRDVSGNPYCRLIISFQNVSNNKNILFLIKLYISFPIIPNRFFSGRMKNNRHFGYPETKITDFKISGTRLGTTLHHCRLILEMKTEPVSRLVEMRVDQDKFCNCPTFTCYFS